MAEIDTDPAIPLPDIPPIVLWNALRGEAHRLLDAARMNTAGEDLMPVLEILRAMAGIRK